VTKIAMLVGVSLLSLYLARLNQPSEIAVKQSLLSREFIVWAGVQCLVLILFKMDRSHWRLLSLEDIPSVGGMSLVAGLIGSLSAFMVNPHAIEGARQRFVLLECIFFIVSIVAMQVAISLVRSLHRSSLDRIRKRRVLIFSADQTGADILASLRRLCPECDPLGFVDTREETRGTYLSGLPVLGGTQDILNIADTYGVHELLISSMQVGSNSALGLVQLCKVSGINFTVVRSIRQDIQISGSSAPYYSGLTLTMGFPITAKVSEVTGGIPGWTAND
jgi:FlaA1/EpsC-like NDP-sugar epimerase